MRVDALDGAYLVVPDGAGPHPGVVVVHEAAGLNDNIRSICRRFAAAGYAALGVDLFQGRNRVVCMARMIAGGMAGNLDHVGVPELKAALARLSAHPDVDAGDEHRPGHGRPQRRAAGGDGLGDERSVADGRLDGGA